jgi:thiol-disulfide isomerase/thioredoxin
MPFAHASRLVLVVGLFLARTVSAHDWNDKGIAWKSFADGLAAAAKEKKPICLVVFTEWCPHCKVYAGVFHDPKVVERAKDFVMVHVDKDQQPDVSKKYAPDGEYIPRTYFLKADGTLDPAIKAPREKFQYFYDEKDPASVLAAMDSARQKLK